MRVRSIPVGVAAIALFLGLSTSTSHAEECTASISSFAQVGYGISGKEAIYLAALDVDPDVTNAELVVHFGVSGPNVTFDVQVMHNKSSMAVAWSWLRLSP